MFVKQAEQPSRQCDRRHPLSEGQIVLKQGRQKQSHPYPQRRQMVMKTERYEALQWRPFYRNQGG